jgi:hypothetical protein
VGSAPPLPGEKGPLTAPPLKEGRLVRRLLIGCGIAAAVEIVTFVNEIPYLVRVRDALRTSTFASVTGDLATLIRVDRRQHAANLIFLVIFLATAGLWIVWQHRAHRALRGFWGDLHFSDRDAALWWVLPFANLVMPLRVNRELRSRAAEAAGESDPQLGRLSWWWGVYLGAGGLAVVAGRFSDMAKDAAVTATVAARPWSLLLWNEWFLIASRAMVIVAAAFAFRLVKRDDDLLEKAFKRAGGKIRKR